jgi:ribulose-phosphate 3-epimerase
MDGHFVPNLSYGMPIVEGIRRLTDLPLDVHLMISEPAKYARQFVEAGADLLTIHAEIGEQAAECLAMIRELGVGAGLAINPKTELGQVEHLLGESDLLLVMGVEAGFGGQSFNDVALQKLTEASSRHPHLLLEVDGGINLSTISNCYASGARLFVVGSAIFGRDDYRQAVEQLAAAIGN